MGWFFVFFFLSGFCSILYELVWLRLTMAQFGDIMEWGPAATPTEQFGHAADGSHHADADQPFSGHSAVAG